MKDESLHTIPLVKFVLDKYGPDCLDWEPAVMQKTLHDDYQAAKINVLKILSGIALLQNDRFWNDWQTFQFLCQALNNNHPSASTIQELSVGQMMVAVDTANKLRESVGNLSYVPVYSEEVAKFIASQALNQGIWFLPEPLEFASNYASRTMLYCMDCENKEYVDEELENVCPVCTAKYDTTSLASFTPNPERLKKGFGTNVKIITEHSTMGVQKTLQKLLTSKSPFLMEDNADHVCAAKLMVGIRYFLQRRKEAKNELRIA